MNNVPTHKRQLLNINELVCFFAITSLAPRFCSRKLLNKSIHLNAPMPALHPLSSCMFMYIKALFLFIAHHILDELRLCPVIVSLSSKAGQYSVSYCVEWYEARQPPAPEVIAIRDVTQPWGMAGKTP